MTRHIAFICEPLEQIDPKTSTTWTLMCAAQALGHRVFWMEAADLHIKDHIPVGFMTPVELHDNGVEYGESFLTQLDKLDLIWWRKATPYNLDDLFVLDALQMVSSSTPIINDPRTLRSINEHLYQLQFPDLLPPTLVTKKTKAVQAFLSEVGGKAIVRALQPAQTGQSFFLRMGDPNLTTLMQTLTHQETQCVMVQKLITEPGLDGDKRLFLLDGAFLDIALQIPAIGEMRGSFERGAEPATTQPTDKDLKLAQIVGAQLSEDGIFFATIDVSDGYIVDINISCPQGLPQLQSIVEDDLASIIFKRIERLF